LDAVNNEEKKIQKVNASKVRENQQNKKRLVIRFQSGE
jgi:hypothetical protein